MFNFSRHKKPEKWYFEFDKVRSLNEIESSIATLLKQKEIQKPGSLSSNMRIGILLHLFHIDLWKEMRKYIRNIRQPFDLYVNLVEGSCAPDQLIKLKKKIESCFSHSVVVISDNKGLDIGGSLSLIQHIIEADLDYDLFLFIHTKKSEQSTDKKFGNRWRRELLNSLLGTPRIAAGIIELFRTNPDIGMLGSKLWHIQVRNGRNFALGENEPTIMDYMKMFNISLNIDDLEFIGGTMFWVDAGIILKKFKEVNLVKLRNNLEEGYFINDRPTRTHAFERFYGLLILNEGKKLRGI